MAFNVGKNNKDLFKKLKKLTPRQRLDYVNRQGQQSAVTDLSQLTPEQFSQLFPRYLQGSMVDVSGFRTAISRRSSQKQDDINFGLSQGAKTVEEAERYGQWRRRGGGGKDEGGTTSSGGYTGAGLSGKTVALTVGRKLMKDYGLTDYQAAGILAHLGHESRGFKTSIQEQNPIAGRGGFGLAQWTGPRRVALEQFAAKNGLNINDVNTQYSFMVQEPEFKRYIGAVKNSKSMEEAAQAFAPYESGGDPRWVAAWGSRYNYGRSALTWLSSGSDPQVDMTGVSRYSTKSGGYFGESEQCVALSKHFSNVGAAKDWRVKSGSISAGSVIATMSYNDGSGGKMAKNMPDGRSHYHTGIALNSPNESGDVLILEQFVGQPARVRMINIHNYNGERWGVVEGGDPSASSMKAVELGKSLANPDQLALIDGTGAPGAAPGKQAGVEVKPVQEVPVARPTATSNEQQQQYPAEQQQQQGPANKQTATVEKVDKSKSSVESYKFDPDKYWKEVKTKQPMADSMFAGKEYVMKETYKGFEEAQAAGAIKWDKKTNEIKILDPNHAKVQQIYKDMQDNNIDRNAFLSKTEAGGSGSVKIRHVKRHSAAHKGLSYAPDDYQPDVTTSGLNRDSKLVEYKNSKIAKALGLTDAQYNAHREAVASIESSGGKYNLRGGSSNRFSGAYQIGGAELKEVAKRLGEQAPVMKMKGRRTPVANEQFMKDPYMQERYYDEFNLMLHERLMKNKKYAAMSPEDKLKHVGMAHNAGAGGVNKFLRTGKADPDKFGTKPEKYAHRVGAQLAGLKAANDTAVASAEATKTTPQVAEAPKQEITPPMESSPIITHKETAKAEPSRLERFMERLNPYDIGATAKQSQSYDEADKVNRGLKADPVQRMQPGVPSGSLTTPSNMTPETTTPASDKMSMTQTPVEKPQGQTTIDPGLNRQNREFPSVSLERAIKNTTDPSGAMHFGQPSLSQ